MDGGVDLLGGPAIEPRKRGRPKGSGNRRARDLKGFIDAKYGGSAAQQSAALCLVTPAELKTAGGSMAKAQVNKALDLVGHVRKAQEGRDGWLRQVVRDALEELAGDLPAEGAELRALVGGFIKRVKEGTSGFGLREALELITRERGQLLPYTDMRQPLAVELAGKGLAPSVVVMGAGPVAPLGLASVEKAEVFEGVFSEVSPLKSHADGQGLDLPGLLAPPPTD